MNFSFTQKGKKSFRHNNQGILDNHGFAKILALIIVGLFIGTSVPPQLLTTTVKADDIEDGLVAYWSFDNQADPLNDDSTSGTHDGTNHGTSWTSNSAVGTGALSFDGSSNYVSIGHHADLDFTSSFTIATWFKTDNPSKSQHMVSTVIDGSNYPYNLIVTPYQDGAETFGATTWNNDQGCVLQSSPSSIEPNTWYFGVYTFDGNNYSLYLGDENDITEVDNSFNNPYDPPTPYKRFHFGRNPWGSAYFDGILDEVRVYNKALSESEIQTLYDQGGGNPEEFIIYDHFDDNTLDPIWQIYNANNANGWTYSETGTNFIVDAILPIDINTDTEGEWSIMKLIEDVDSVGDFELDFVFSWGSENSDKAMQKMYIELFDVNGHRIVASGYNDAWISQKGSKSAQINGDIWTSGYNSLPYSGNAEIKITRENGNINIKWDNNEILTGYSNEPIDQVKISFWFYPFFADISGNLVALFGSESIDLISLKGEVNGGNNNEKPWVSINLPQDNTLVSGYTQFSGTAGDIDGDSIEYVQLYDMTNFVLLGEATGTNSWIYNWDTNNFPDGSYRIMAVSYDGITTSQPFYLTVFVSNNGIGLPWCKPFNIYDNCNTVSIYGKIILDGGSDFIEHNIRWRIKGSEIWTYDDWGESTYEGGKFQHGFMMNIPDKTYEVQVGLRNSVCSPLGYWNEEETLLVYSPIIYWNKGDFNYEFTDVWSKGIPINDHIGTADVDSGGIDLDIGPYYASTAGWHGCKARIGVKEYTPNEDKVVKVVMKGRLNGHIQKCTTAALIDSHLSCIIHGLQSKEIRHYDRDDKTYSDEYIWESNEHLLEMGKEYTFSVEAHLKTFNICTFIPIIGDFACTETEGSFNVILDRIALYSMNINLDKSLEINLMCPFDLEVKDANGRITNKTLNEIPYSIYNESDYNLDGEIDDKIIIPFPTNKSYNITVIPEDTATIQDTFSIFINNSGEGFFLVENATMNSNLQYSFNIGPPVTIIKIGNPFKKLIFNFVTSSTKFNLSYIDYGSEINNTFYRIHHNGTIGDWITYNNNFSIYGMGKNYIEYYSTDYLSNYEEINTEIYIVDDSPPTTTKTLIGPANDYNNEYVTMDTQFNLTATDDSSGVNSTHYRIWYDGEWYPLPGMGSGLNQNFGVYQNNFSLFDVGKHYIEYYSVDNVGNVEEVHNQTHYVMQGSLFGWYPNVKIPYNQVSMNVTLGQDSYFSINLTDVPDGYHVTNDVYYGWCFEKNVKMTQNQIHPVKMCHSYDPNMPDAFRNANWSMINYVINNKGDASKEVIQDTIWSYIEGIEPDSSEAVLFIENIGGKGSGFSPTIGNKIAVLLYLDPDAELPDDYPPVQNTFIEVPLYYTSCNTTFWYENTDAWPESIDPDDLVGEYFNLPSYFDELEDYNLTEILGGNIDVPQPFFLWKLYAGLLREAVAGLLNAKHPCIHYPVTYDQIIVSVHDSFSSIAKTAILQMIYEVYNLLGCDCDDVDCCSPCCS